MYGLGLSNLGYVMGLETFIQDTIAYGGRNQHDGEYLYGPCVDCKNEKQFRNIEQIRSHLIRRGFKQNYVIWTKHGKRVGTYRMTNVVISRPSMRETPSSQSRKQVRTVTSWWSAAKYSGIR